MKRILVAVDATEASVSVAAFVNEFFGGLDVEVLAMHVDRRPGPWSPADVAPGGLFPWPYAPIPRSFEAEASAVEDARRRGAHAIDQSGLDRDGSVVAIGDPVAMIEEAAERHDADLIVVGRSHRGLLDRLFSPSPATELAKEAPVPVLVVA